jgi:hypothetical protein
MTTRERLERKLEKRQEWADKANARSAAALDNARQMTEHIPLGQPILVGHYSEAGHRRTMERCAAQMDKGVEEYRRAEYHESKANGLERYLENTIFDDDPDAEEKISAKLAELERIQEQWKATNKIIRSKASTEEKALQLVALGLQQTAAYNTIERGGIPSYALQNNNANIRRYRQRLESIRTRKQRAERAQSAGNGILIEEIPGTSMVRVTFAEKPEREIINALKGAGFYWRNGSWNGYADKLPEIK